MTLVTKKIVSVILCIVTALSFAVNTAAKVQISDYVISANGNFEAECSNAILYCDDRDQYLYEKGASEILYVSAFAKLMVGAVALELYGNRLEEDIVITDELIDGVSGLTIYLEKGETLTIGQLLHATLMGGANDAATVLARLYTGNINDFIALMNQRAKDAGAVNTTYKNVTGLYADGMTTTLYDQIKIAKYAYSVKGLTDITAKDKYIIPKTEKFTVRTVLSRNHLVSTYRDTRYKTDGVNGLCCGTTDESGDVLLVSAVRGGMTYFMAFYGGGVSENDNHTEVYKDAVSLLSYAENDFGFVKVLSEKKLMCEIPVKYNTTVDTVALVPEDDVTLYLPLDLDIEKDLQYSIVVYKEALEAPVEERQAEGQVIVKYDGQEICRADLVTKTPVSRNKILYVLDRIEEFTSSRRFIVTLVIFVLLLIIYVLISAVVRHQMKKRRRRLR